MRSFSVFSIAIAIALAGCSGTTAKVPPTAPVTAPQAASPSYTVTAILEAYPDGTARACHTIETSLPGECGSSVLISHLGSARLPFDHVARTRGAYFTPIMQLIGTWTGTSLALTAPPLKSVSETDVMKVWSATKPPSPAQMHAGYPTAAGFRDQQVLLADNADLLARGILVMENGFGAAGLYIMVAVGDPATVDLLRSRYPVQEIDSWLSPTP